MSRTWASALFLCLVGAIAAPAEARTDDTFAYPFEEVWSSAVRMLRVDLRFPVTDKDRDNGFLLFEYQDRGRKVPGSLEVFRTRRGERERRVRVTVQVPAMPSYVERMLVDRLGRKLRDDWGEPIEAPPARDDDHDDGGDGGGEGDGDQDDDGSTPGASRRGR